MAEFKDHFSSNNSGYAAHRPTYPKELVDFLAAIAPSRQLALDVGCGTGQLSVPLADRFAQVVATDASAQQILSAAPHARVTYRTAPAEDSGLVPHSADLITVAQAAHWLDLTVFYDEVRRIARTDAAIALITYGVLRVEGDAADAVAQRFYYDVIGSYWPPERKHVENGYRLLDFPFEEVVAPPLAIDVSWRRDDLVGYIDTWSAVRAAEKVLGPEPVAAFRDDLARAWGDPEQTRRVRWPLSLRVGHVRAL